MIKWEPYHSSTGDPPRTRGLCRCGALEFACQGGHYLVLRRACTGHREETARGRYPQARAVWDQLLREHIGQCDEPDNPIIDIWLDRWPRYP